MDSIPGRGFLEGPNPQFLQDPGSQGAPGPQGFRTVGVASAEIMPLNDLRTGVLFVNTSPNMIYLSKGWAAALGSFIPLFPMGGWFSEPNERGRVWTGRWFAIASVTGSNLAVSEDW